MIIGENPVTNIERHHNKLMQKDEKKRNGAVQQHVMAKHFRGVVD